MNCQNVAITALPPVNRPEAINPVTYTVAGRRFIVEPVFKKEQQSPKTMGDILLRLMLHDA